jgi:hypothetical protein
MQAQTDESNGTGGVARRWFRSPSLPLPPRIGSLSKSLYIHIVKGSTEWKQSECLAAYSHVKLSGISAHHSSSATPTRTDFRPTSTSSAR